MFSSYVTVITRPGTLPNIIALWAPHCSNPQQIADLGSLRHVGQWATMGRCMMHRRIDPWLSEARYLGPTSGFAGPQQPRAP
jgi:hypothetical protein